MVNTIHIFLSTSMKNSCTQNLIAKKIAISEVYEPVHKGAMTMTKLTDFHLFPYLKKLFAVKCLGSSQAVDAKLCRPSLMHYRNEIDLLREKWDKVYGSNKRLHNK